MRVLDVEKPTEEKNAAKKTPQEIRSSKQGKRSLATNLRRTLRVLIFYNLHSFSKKWPLEHELWAIPKQGMQYTV